MDVQSVVWIEAIDFSSKEEAELFAACDKPELRHRAQHLKSIILVALYTGLRRGGILKLRWTDIDFVQAATEELE